MTSFDHNATAPLHASARQAWLDAAEKFPGDPSSPHRLGRRAEAALDVARERLAGFMGAGATELVWTSGTTEACNTVLHHFATTLPPATEVWISAIEHPAILEPTRHYFETRVRSIPVCRGGTVDLGWLAEQLPARRPSFVAVMAANHETGVLQPWPEVQALCRAHGVPFVCDATQWLGRLGAQGLGQCDWVMGSGYKCGGPRGVGFLKCPPKTLLTPLLLGGPQEYGRRAGTENVAGVMALLAALETREWDLVAGEDVPRLSWRDAFVQTLLTALPGAEIVGVTQPRLWNTVAALMPPGDTQARWLASLERLGFAVSTGSACGSGKEYPSHVLTAMGCTATDAGRALRFSSGWETTPTDWGGLQAALQEIYTELGAPQTPGSVGA